MTDVPPFGDWADDYEFGRPGYPTDVLAWATEGAGVAVDVGAGTGKLTRALLDLGLRVIAVERDGEMVTRITRDSWVLRCDAEKLPLRDASVDVVAAGQALHWFAGSALVEMQRVMRRGGRLVAVDMLLDDRVSWVGTMCDVVGIAQRLSAMHHAEGPELLHAALVNLLPRPDRQEGEFNDPADLARVLARARSSSKFAKLSAEVQAAALAMIRAAVPLDVTAIPYVCRVWRYTL